MFAKISIGIIFTFFYSFVYAKCDMIDKNKLLTHCKPKCVTVADNLDYSIIPNNKYKGASITVSKWDNQKQTDKFTLYAGESNSMWVCPNQKITTSFALYEYNMSNDPIIHETHCGIFTIKANSKSPSDISIRGKLEDGAINYHYFSKISYPNSGINNLGVFKGSEKPAVCTPNNHPSATENGEDPH